MQDVLSEAQQAFADGTLRQYLAAKFVLASTTTKLGIGAIAIGATVFIVSMFAGIHNVTGPGPDQAAKEFMQAVADQNEAQVANLTCDGKRQQLRDTLQGPWAIMSLGQALLGTDIKIDVSRLTYTVVSNDGTYAIVHIQGPLATQGLDLFGTLDVGLFGGPSTMDINEPMLHEHDRWVVCR